MTERPLEDRIADLRRQRPYESASILAVHEVVAMLDELETLRALHPPQPPHDAADDTQEEP